MNLYYMMPFSKLNSRKHFGFWTKTVQYGTKLFMAKRKRHIWLMKTEPDTFSIDDLRERGSERWDGVRNYQARNFLREMMPGDQVLIHHSQTKPPAVVGLAEITAEAIPDVTATDPKSPYFDPKHTEDSPRWFAPEVSWRATFATPVTLPQLKDEPKLKDMLVVQRGQRLSVQPVTATEFKLVCQMAGAQAP